MFKKSIFMGLLLVLIVILVLQTAPLYAQEDQPEAVICPQCGEKNESNALFCRKCGFAFPKQELKLIRDKFADTLQVYHLSREELIQLIELIVERTSRTGGIRRKDLKLVGDMSKKDLENLIRRLLNEQRIIEGRTSGEGALGKFLQIIGAITLAVLGIIIISS